MSMLQIGDTAICMAERFGSFKGWRCKLVGVGDGMDWVCVLLDDNRGGTIQANNGELTKVDVTVLEGVIDYEDLGDYGFWTIGGKNVEFEIVECFDRGDKVRISIERMKG